MRTVQQLEAEIERLRAKLSPLEDKEFTALIRELTARRSPAGLFGALPVQGVLHYFTTPQDLWGKVISKKPNIHDITKLGRTLRALGWVQTAKDGKRYYIMPVSEYHEQVRQP